MNEESEAFNKTHPLNKFDFDRDCREDWVDRLMYEKVPFRNHILSGGIEISPSAYFALKTPTDIELHAKLNSLAQNSAFLHSQIGNTGRGFEELPHKSQPFTYPAVSSQEKEIASKQIRQFGVTPVRLDIADPSLTARNERITHSIENAIPAVNQPGRSPLSVSPPLPSQGPLSLPNPNEENTVQLPSLSMGSNPLYQPMNNDVGDITILPEMNLVGPSVLSDPHNVSTLSTMTGKGQLDVEDLHNNIPSLATPSLLLNPSDEVKTGNANRDESSVEKELNDQPSMFLQPSLFEPARPSPIDQIPPLPKSGRLRVICKVNTSEIVYGLDWIN